MKRPPRRRARGAQGLGNLGTWRLLNSEDLKRRRQQKRENRRPHRLRSASRPDSVLGAPDLHWTEPARLSPRTGRPLPGANRSRL